MNASMPDQATGNLILARRHAIAQAVVARQYSQHAELPQRYEQTDREQCVHDTESHLSFLAAAMIFSSRPLYRDYVCWVKTILTSCNTVPQEIEHSLHCLWSVLQEQLPAENASAVGPYIKHAIGVEAQGPLDLPTLLASDDALTLLARQYLQALFRTEHHEASFLIQEALSSGVKIEDLYLQVFQRCQREIGRLWQLNQLTVAQEHYCTAATQFMMAQFYPYLFSVPKNGRRLVAASVAGEYHEVGLRIVADLLEANGWNAIYLGADLPAQSLLKTVEQHHPDLLLISVTMAYHLPAVEELIALVQSLQTGLPIKIMVGGYPFNLDADLWRRVGADAYATDAGKALELVGRLFDPMMSGVDRGTPAESFAAPPLSSPRVVRPAGGERAQFDGLSRLNSDLLTLQRVLVQTSAELEHETAKRARLEEQIQQVWKMEAVGRLAGGVAHSLNNLMTTVLGYSDFMLENMTPSDPFFAGVQEIKRSSSRTAALTRKLLSFSRQQLLTLRPVDLNHIVSGLEQTIRAMLGRVSLEINLAPGLATTKADQDQIEEAILALVRNALDAMPDGGHVTIQTKNVTLSAYYIAAHPEVRPGPYVMFAISDTGRGMDEEALGHLFEPFYSSKDASSGGGLELAAIYGYIKQCSGDIAVESVLNEGTTFRLYLPSEGASDR